MLSHEGFELSCAGVVAGLVSYIVSNGINWLLDYAEDAWERWRSPDRGDDGSDKYPTGDFGKRTLHRSSGQPGANIGNIGSLERYAASSLTW